jgi:hypothetical protein
MNDTGFGADRVHREDTEVEPAAVAGRGRIGWKILPASDWDPNY